MERFDVAIVGASIAGCMAARCYAEHPLRIAVLEKKPAIESYKVLCTHFIQPVALPVLRRYKLDRILEDHGAVATKAAFHTEAGWINPAGPYSNDPAQAHAYNIDRQTLDPLLRAQLLDHPAVALRFDSPVRCVAVQDDGRYIVHYGDEAAPRSIDAALLVAADGRQSTVAKLVGNQENRYDNERAVYYAYFDGIEPPVDNRSLFFLAHAEMAFVYPLSAGRTLLCVAIAKERAKRWRSDGNLAARIVEFYEQFPDVPGLSRARCTSRVFGYADYPNISREPVWKNIAFIGDAALSLDAMAGVGCGFAMVAAEMLVDSTAASLGANGHLAQALEAYRKRFAEVFAPHARAIMGDSLMPRSATELIRAQELFAHMSRDSELQDKFISLTGRLISPQKFQLAYLSALSKSPRPRA
jgi:flavin-dependent dehydrogenase